MTNKTNLPRGQHSTTSNTIAGVNAFADAVDRVTGPQFKAIDVRLDAIEARMLTKGDLETLLDKLKSKASEASAVGGNPLLSQVGKGGAGGTVALVVWAIGKSNGWW